ncbi:MAG TPA: Gfo/Idh/MocA family oxidoreductase, partial [Tepidisphaeraceae bacterium]|nr:Gfo/Idh/MocA family oxidoreductase [Tepidisphaeraceae bacterium]
LADARRMVAAAREHGRRIFVGAQRKFSPEFLRAKQIVDSGALGRIHFVSGAIHYYWSPVFTNTMSWRGRKEESGGIAIIDSGYHILDAVMAFHGKPETVFASTGRLRAVKDGTYDIDDKAALILNWADGSLGSLTISFATVPGEFRVVLHGQEGTLDISDAGVDLYRGSERVEQIAANEAGTNLLEAQLAHCIEALQTGKPSLCDTDRALDVQAVIEAAYQSDASGQVVAVE